MKIFEWDEDKNSLNIQKHKLSFDMAKPLFDNPLAIIKDTRKDYKETRYIGMGKLEGRLMVVVFTMKTPNNIRIISFRKANSREQNEYAKN